MGSPVSPALAQIICAYYENNLITNLQREGIHNPIEGVRYVDDLTAFVYYDPSNATSKAHADDIAHRIEFGYHKDMELEVEDTSAPFKFLSSMVTVDERSGHINAAFYNKNYDDIARDAPQTFPTYQDFASYAPARQKMAVTISSIHRIGASCNSRTAAQSALYTLCGELRLLSYPHKIIKRALCRVQNTDARWRGLSVPPASVYGPVSFADWVTPTLAGSRDAGWLAR